MKALTMENKPKDLAERIEFLMAYRRELGLDIADFMIHEGFCECPASANYHGAYEGGLFDHCYAMAVSLTTLTSKLELPWGNPESPFRVAFFHDLCKLDNYKKVYEQPLAVGNEAVTPYHYDYNQEKFLGGHGEKSAIVTLQHTHLTEEELMCIRYHMGAYEKEDWEYYDRAIKKYPVVLYVHTADMIASKVYGV